MPLPKLQEEQVIKCEGEITEYELLKSLKSIKNDKSPGNDGLTKEFYETFWEEIKTPLSNSTKNFTKTSSYKTN